MATSALNPSGRSSITVLVLGDAGVGKTSLISSLVSASWSARVPPVLQPVMVPPTLMPEHIQLTIIDSSSEPRHEHEWRMHLRPQTQGVGGVAAAPASSKASLLADAVLLVVSSDVPDSFARVESHWLPLLEEHAARYHIPRRPVILAINKSAQDGSEDSSAHRASSSPGPDANGDMRPASMFDHLVQSYRVASVLPCSAKYLLNLTRLFHAANTVILAPVEPLFELHAPASAAHISTGVSASASAVSLGPSLGCMRFKLLTQRALLRIFRLFDADQDGVLSYAELDRMHQVNFKGKKLGAQAFDQLMARLSVTNKDFVRATGMASRGLAATKGFWPAPVPGTGLVAPAAPSSVGLTFSGLLHFHFLFLERSRHLWPTWALVSAFGYELGAVNQLPQTSVSVAPPPMPLARGGSSNIGGGASSSSSAPAAALAASSLQTAPLPSLGSLVLQASYCKLGEPFNPALSYELSAVAVQFLTALFHRYDSDDDGLLCIKASGDAVAPPVLVDASPSTTCSLSASCDLERMFLTCPDVPFSVPSFTQFVTAIPASRLPASGGASYISLEGWLACWALLLYNFATPALPVLQQAPAAALSSNSNLSASFGAPSSSGASSSAAAVATTPNPDVILRYLLYLCFPVSPAVLDRPELAERTDASKSRAYVPRIQRCIHVTPRTRDAIDLAQHVNERILATDPSLSSGTIRAQVAEASSLRPRTVVAFVLGSSGCGKTALIDCMLGKAPMAPMRSQHQASGASGALQRTDSAEASPPAASVPHARTFAARLPLSHLPVQPAAVAASGASAAAASDSVVIDASLRSDPNRFLLLKEVPSSLCMPLLSSAAFTAASCGVVLLLYDGTSVSSLEFVQRCLQICFDKQLPVMVVQTKADCANCSNPKSDFAYVDWSVRVESFSALSFWAGVNEQQRAAVGGSVALPASCTLFERIWHAGRHTSSHVLTSLSAARRAKQRSRWVLSGLALLAGAVGAVGLAQWHGLVPRLLAWHQENSGRHATAAAAEAATAATTTPAAALATSSAARISQPRAPQRA